MLNRILLACVTAVCPVALLAQTVTRFDYNDPRITYTGTWYPNTNSLEIGGSATLTNLERLPQANVVFDGTGITWIGVSDGYSGLCYVTLDGVQTVVDTSNAASATHYQQALFTAQGLTAGLHRLTIEVIHQRDSTTQGSWVWVNAFEHNERDFSQSTAQVVGAGAAPQTSVAANYNGEWFTTTRAEFSGGSASTQP